MDSFIQFVGTLFGLFVGALQLLVQFVIAVLSFFLVLARMVLNLFHLL